MRRRDFTIGLLLAAAVPTAPAKHRGLAIIRAAGPVSIMNETAHPFWRAFFEELGRLGDVEGQNLTVERYTGEGRERPDAVLVSGTGELRPYRQSCERSGGLLSTIGR
jgi:putative ABC transport system substrate-binding protein